MDLEKGYPPSYDYPEINWTNTSMHWDYFEDILLYDFVKVLFALCSFYYEKGQKLNMERKTIKKFIIVTAGMLITTVVITIASVVWNDRSEAEVTTLPNIILISIDTTRRDHCSVYGYQYNTTPNLRRFANQGTTFALAYAPSSTTAVSHSTMFTGLYPNTHGVLKNGMKLAKKHNTLAEYLKANHYQTAALVSVFVLESKFGYAQGFKYFYDKFKSDEATIHHKQWGEHPLDNQAFDRRADYTLQLTIAWLTKKRNPKKPFFLFVHFFDPHKTYIPPEPYASRFAPKKENPTELEKIVGNYDGEIAFTDSQIGTLLEKLDQMDLSENTLVIITADHGEGLMQHNWLQHGLNIYEEAVRVPLLVRWPNHIPQGKIISEPVGLISLAPTILDLVGIKPSNATFQGQSLGPVLRGEMTLDKNRPIFLYRQHYKEGEEGGAIANGDKFGIRVGIWKYIEGEKENTKELFDLSIDPGELTNLHNTHPQKAGELTDRLIHWKRSCIRTKPETNNISEEDLRKLKSLGYTN